MKIYKIKQILLIIFLVSCGSGSSDKSPEPFNFVIEAVNEAYDYSLIEIKANSSSSILSLQLISDDLTLISSNNSTLSVLLPKFLVIPSLNIKLRQLIFLALALQ